MQKFKTHVFYCLVKKKLIQVGGSSTLSYAKLTVRHYMIQAYLQVFLLVGLVCLVGELSLRYVLLPTFLP